METENTIRSKSFWIASVISAVIIFIALINTNRGYRAETDILILPKSPMAVKNIEQIIGNAKAIPLTVKFYDNLLSSDDSIEDSLKELVDYKRKEAWNAKIKISRLDQSGILRLTIFDTDRYQAEEMSRHAALSLADAMSQYYNIRTDIDIRIIDGPVTDYSAKSILLYGILSLFLALTICFILFNLLEIIFQNFLEEKKQPKIKFPSVLNKDILSDYFQAYSFEKKKPVSAESKKVKPEPEAKKPTEKIAPKPEAKPEAKVEEKTVVAHSKKSSAPENLPIASEADIFRVRTAEELKPKEEKPEEILPEPTPEEVKERLNRLLSGKI